MSRGPGRVQRIIYSAFSIPEKSYTVLDLFHHAYPNSQHFEKKHGVAIKRAAAKVCLKTGWRAMRKDTQGGGYIYYDPCNLISYATARLKGDMLNRYQHPRYRGQTDADILSELEVGGKSYNLIAEGGDWWRHVRMAQARRDGDDTTYQALKAQNDGELAAIVSALKGQT